MARIDGTRACVQIEDSAITATQTWSSEKIKSEILNDADGDVVGPGSSTDNALVRWDGTTGKLVQNSTATLSDTGTLTAPILTATTRVSTNTLTAASGTLTIQNVETIVPTGFACDLGQVGDEFRELHVNDAYVDTAVHADTITEHTTDNGVVIDGVLAKDGALSADAVYTDTITEQTLDAGVNIEGVLVKDGTLRINAAYTLPLADGDASDMLLTDGAGALYWAPAATPPPVYIEPIVNLPFSYNITDSGTGGASWSTVGGLTYSGSYYRTPPSSAFFGGNNYVQTSNILLSNQPSFTITFWADVHLYSFDQRILRVREVGTNGSVFLIDYNGGSQRFTLNASTMGASLTVPVGTPGGGVNWTHIAIVFNSTTKLYVNGVLGASGTATRNIGTSDGIEVGGYGTPNVDTFFTGYFDDFRIYNRELTATEIGLDMSNQPIPDANTANAIPRMVGSTSNLQTSKATVDDQGTLSTSYIRMPTDLTIPMYPPYSFNDDIQTGMYGGGPDAGKTIFASGGLPVGQFDADGITVASGKTMGVYGEYRLPATSGTTGQVLTSAGNDATCTWETPLSGPGSATDDAIARFDGTTGDLIQNSSATLSDAGLLTTTSAAIGGISIADIGGGQKRITMGTSTITGDADDVLTLAADNTIALQPATSAIVNIGGGPRLLITSATTTSYNAIAVDTINERTTANGVSVDGCLIKDGAAALANAVPSGTITNAMVNASAAIAYSKLNLGGSIVNADINASAAIADTKLATISTAGKVSNSATTATSANSANAIVARDASGKFNASSLSLSTMDAYLIGQSNAQSINSGSATAFTFSSSPTVYLAQGITRSGGTFTLNTPGMYTAQMSGFFSQDLTATGVRGVEIVPSGHATINQGTNLYYGAHTGYNNIAIGWIGPSDGNTTLQFKFYHTKGSALNVEYVNVQIARIW